MPYGYIYKTINLINGKMYIGQKKSSKVVNSYFGSGALMKKAIEKYGKENFSREILDWAETFEELQEKEQYWIAYYNAYESDDFYNLDKGGKGILGYKHTKKAKEKISENNARYWKGKSLHPNTMEAAKEARKKLAEEGKLKRRGYTEEQKQKYSLAMKEYYKTHTHPNKGKHSSEETRQKLRESHLGKSNGHKGIPLSEETKKKVSEGLYRYYSTHKHKGHSFTDEEKARISASVTKANTGKKFINNGEITKFVTKEEAERLIQEGWIYGNLSNCKPRQNTDKLQGRRWMNNGIENRIVAKEKIEDFLKNGYIFGYKKELSKNGL